MNLRIRLDRRIDDSYDIVIGTPLVRAAQEIGRRYRSCRIFVITDTNVGKLYGERFAGSVRGAGAPCRLLQVPAGEKSKSREAKARLEDRLLELNAGRDSLIIALGGGMIGDLAGFVAATLHRGVPYLQLPTSLLAQIDSSVGGKVAVDHPVGKNLIGAFHQPERVYIDPACLRTLPDRQFTNGLAEAVKYGMILDRPLFEMLERSVASIRNRNRALLLRIVRRCCELKKLVVEKDEREKDVRRILNFGHTIGHAVELLSGYRIPHGRAVAIGMVAEARMASARGEVSYGDVARLRKLLSGYGLPTEIPARLNLEDVVRATAMDKKSRGGMVYYTLPRRIGRAVTGVGISQGEALRLLRTPAGVQAR